MDSPECARVSSITRSRRGSRLTTEGMSDDGWSLLDTARESLQYIVRTTSVSSYALTIRSDFSSPADVFGSLLSHQFVASVIDDIKNEHPDSFMESNGRHTTRNTPVGVADVYQALACRTWIQGQGLSSGATIDDALRNARSYLANHCSVPIHGFRKLRLIHRKFYFSGGGALQKQLNRQFTSALCSLGEVLCCDEKLFRFTGRGGIVRKVPSKPARVGIWHYQAVVTLPTGDPFLVYTRTHNSSCNLGESTATAEIVKEWAQLIKDYRQDTTMCMDSYYLSGAGRGILRDLNVRYIAALKPDRFTRIVNFLSPHVQSTGDSAWAWNNERNEAAVYHSSRDKNIGKKFTLSNCFSLRRVRQPRDYVPIYDEYRAMFSGCDKFNQLLHNKTFPYRLPKDTNLAEAKNIWNYLFTSTLINTWNLWNSQLKKRDASAQTPSFSEFCNTLAVDIVDKLCV